MLAKPAGSEASRDEGDPCDDDFVIYHLGGEFGAWLVIEYQHDNKRNHAI